MPLLNLSNTPALRLALAYALHDPGSLLPHATISNFVFLPIPVSSCLPSLPDRSRPKIRAIVLDKDNTLCPPNTAMMHPAYLNKLKRLRESEEFKHNENSILIVSNTAGSTRAEDHEAEAKAMELELGIPVLRQVEGKKKPLCREEILAFFREKGVTDKPEEIVVLGDRLATDVLLAREMGSWSIWCKDGFRNPEMPGRDYRGFFARMEGRYERLIRGGYGKAPPLPAGVSKVKQG